MNRLRLEYMTEGFLEAMRVAQLRKNPRHPTPSKRLADYSPEDRSALMGAIKVAHLLGSPEKDKNFEAWAEQRRDQASAEQA